MEGGRLQKIVLVRPVGEPQNTVAKLPHPPINPLRTVFPSGAARLLSGALPNRWDILLLPLVIGVFVLAACGVRQMAVPFVPGERLALSLDHGGGDRQALP